MVNYCSVSGCTNRTDLETYLEYVRLIKDVIALLGLHNTTVVDNLLHLPHSSTHHLVIGFQTFVGFKVFRCVWARRENQVGD